MKILIITRDPWREDNSFGNSFNNIFKDLPDVELAQICCGPGLPQTNTLSKFYYINEKSLVKNLINSKNPTALDIDLEKDLLADENFEENSRNVNHMKFFQKNRFRIFFFLREIIWKISNWKSKELDSFVEDFNPDIIFVQLTSWPYVNNVAMYVQELSNAKMLSYISDDNYTLKQFSLDPSFWAYRLLQRKYIKKIIDKSSILYVISKKQKLEYDQIFGISTKILFKCGHFSEENRPINKPVNPEEIRLLYTGNIALGRAKSLAKIGNLLDELNQNHSNKFHFTIYTNTTLSDSLLNIFEKIKSISLFPSIPFEEVLLEQQKADILVHVESFNLKQKLAVRHSFSTKIVDYFLAAKCILAFGPKDVASMEYLIENKSGIVCDNISSLKKHLIEVQTNPEIINLQAENAWQTGFRNHQEQKIKSNLINDFKNIL